MRNFKSQISNLKKIRRKIIREEKVIYKFLFKYIKRYLKLGWKWLVSAKKWCNDNKYCQSVAGGARKAGSLVWELVKWVLKPVRWLGRKLWKWLRSVLKKFRWLKPTRQFYRDLKKFFFPPKGSLPWKNLIKISFKNLFYNRSRTMVTMGGVGVGVGAIVLLVSFAYGLQDVITKRIIWPDALRVTEALAESTSVKISRSIVDRIKSFGEVEKVAESIRLAGQIDFADSKMDVVVVGANSDYLKLSNINVVLGDGFSERSNLRYEGDSQIERVLAGEDMTGDVAGISSEMNTMEDGDEVDGTEIKYKIRDGVYVPVYSQTKEGLIAGYVLGSIIDTYSGKYVWGSVYDDLSGLGRVVVDNIGVKGKWMKATLPMWEKIDDTSYREVYDGGNKRLEREVYLTLGDVRPLSKVEEQVDDMINDEGMVLGEIDGEEVASVSGSMLSNELSVGTEAARLASKITEEKTEEKSEETIVLKVWDESSQEMLINEAMLRAWDKEAKDVLEKELKIKYLVTGSVMENVAGRLLSEEKIYKITGVVAGGDKPMVYVSLGDLESLGIVNFSSLKVLAYNEQSLIDIRAKIHDLGLVTKSVGDTLIQINRLFRIIRFLLASFGAIALVVALFGMFNTMTVSLLERTREIGVMKSLGTSNLDVVRIFLAEAFLISVGGGLLGIVGGNMVGGFVDKFVFRFSSKVGQNMFMMPLGFAALVFMVVLFVGLLTGWYPSKRASRISALNALRYE